MLHVSLNKQLRRSYQPKRDQVIKYLKASLINKYKFVSISVSIVSIESSQQLNYQYRNQNKPTNVISLAYDNQAIDMLMGDIILCDSIIVEESQAQAKTCEAHYAHMIVHGVLHLQGLDHIIEYEANYMEDLEINILSKLGFNNPYLI